MISKVSFKNFKCLRDVSIDLERFTVLVGPNSSGKSSILQGMDLLCRAFSMVRQPSHPHQLQQNQNNEISLAGYQSRGSKTPVDLAIEVEKIGYRYTSIKRESRPGHHQMAPGYLIASVYTSNNWRDWDPQKDHYHLPKTVLLHLETSKLIMPNPWSSSPLLMAPDGSGLHTALANMALNDPDAWQDLQANLKKIVPTIRRLRHTPTMTNQPSSLLFDTVGADSLAASQVSEGTLLVLGLLAALHSNGRPNFVFFDDLDRGLHPRAQKELVSLLRGLLQTNPDLQIIATTHSPYLLDCMEANEVRMTFLGDDGATTCAPLSSHPQFEKWKDEMTPGEMWSLFGEKWIIEREAS